MMVTSKSRYALKVMMDLASRPQGCLEPRQAIASRQGIPPDYIDQILVRLRQGDMVESVRGRSGGVSLKRPADEITVWDILAVAEDNLVPVLCMSHQTASDCDSADVCTTKGPWEEIMDAIRDRLSGMLLSDMVAKWNTSSEVLLPKEDMVAECRGPKKGAQAR